MTLSFVPGRGVRVLRRLAQMVAVLAVFASPLLGGYQRSDRANTAVVRDDGFNLPAGLRRRLPGGELPARAHEANRLLGGGIAADYLGVPAMDPLAGALAMIGAQWNLRSALALGLPILLALLAGRVFCGYLCVFGVLSRLLEWLTLRVGRLPRLKVPARRPIRYALLAAAVLASTLGLHAVLYLTLPYLLVQHAVYAAWLLGGGGAILSVLLGLVVAGVIFGPTVYCAALCPTGATLGLLGRGRVVRLRVIESPRCGKTCGMCDVACWLSLHPRGGDPGPDCDLCTRCVRACPRNNLHVELGPPRLMPTAAVWLLAAATLALPSHARAQSQVQPELIFEREFVEGDATLAVSVLALRDGDVRGRAAGMRSELSVFVTRGQIAQPDEYGILPQRDYYGGPLRVEVLPIEGGEPITLDFPAANHPVSTQRPSIYRRALPRRFQPGDRIVVGAIDGYLPASIEMSVPRAGTRMRVSDHLLYFLASALFFSGMLSLALAGPKPKPA